MKRNLFIFAVSILSIVLYAKEGALPGTFYVGKGKYVHFSKGNLQYDLNTKTCMFAEHQYDVIGNENIKVTQSDFTGTIDLFGWGTGDTLLFSSTINNDYYTHGFYDWGINPIANGGNDPYMWYTLSRDEWRELFVSRPNAEKLFGQGKINGKSGMILLPDDWVLPEGCSFTPSTESEKMTWNKFHSDGSWDLGVIEAPYATNEYTLEEWQKMEAAGAVFLPCAGNFDYKFHNGTEGIWGEEWLGDYWSSDRVSSNFGYALVFTKWGIYPTSDDANLLERNSVRLVTWADPDPKYYQLPGKFSVSATEQVEFSPGNLQYDVNFTDEKFFFASNQFDVIGHPNVSVGSKEYGFTGTIDLFGWGTGNNPLATSTEYEYYFRGFNDWGKNPIANGGNKADMWRTLSTEEWRYLFSNRPNAKKLFGYATVDDKAGILLLPDDWVLPEGCSFTPIHDLNKLIPDPNSEDWWRIEPGYEPYKENIYESMTNDGTWNKMEAAGAVFLPCAGNFDYQFYDDNTDEVWGLDWLGVYWSSKRTDYDFVYTLTFTDVGFYPNANESEPFERNSVRLVRTLAVDDAVEKIDAPTDMPKAKKIVEDGKIVILLPDGKAYNLLGTEL